MWYPITISSKKKKRKKEEAIEGDSGWETVVDVRPSLNLFRRGHVCRDLAEVRERVV